MQPINRPVTNFHLVSLSNLHTINLEKRLEENRPLLDSLKEDRQFQNVLTLMHQLAVPDKLLLKFLTGQASLSDCTPIYWAKNLIRNIYKDGLRVQVMDHYIEGENWPYDIHFLNQALADQLSTVFKHGYFEPSEKTHCKTQILIRAIQQENISGKLDLSGRDLSSVHLDRANLPGADCKNAKFRIQQQCGSINLAGADCRGTNFGTVNPFYVRLTIMRDGKPINLAGADCREADFGTLKSNQVNLTGANLIGAKSTDPDISQMIKEQELYKKYMLLPYVMAQHNLNFPRELINEIGSELKSVVMAAPL